MSPLIQREILRDRAYSVRDIDSPGQAAIAVAWLASDGWRVGIPGGTTIATGLTQRSALPLMRRTANKLLDRAATRALLTGGNQ